MFLNLHGATFLYLDLHGNYITTLLPMLHQEKVQENTYLKADPSYKYD